MNMTIEELQKQTNINVQEKANLIWDIATALYGEYKPHEYGRVILPMTVIKRFDDTLKDTKQAVVEIAEELDKKGVAGFARDGILKQTAKHNNANMFIKSIFPSEFQRVLVECFTQNNQAFSRLLNNSQFQNDVMNIMAKELYKTLSNDDKSGANQQ